jgi:hypothetical protein
VAPTRSWAGSIPLEYVAVSIAMPVVIMVTIKLYLKLRQ